MTTKETITPVEIGDLAVGIPQEKYRTDLKRIKAIMGGKQATGLMITLEDIPDVSLKLIDLNGLGARIMITMPTKEAADRVYVLQYTPKGTTNTGRVYLFQLQDEWVIGGSEYMQETGKPIRVEKVIEDDGEFRFTMERQETRLPLGALLATNQNVVVTKVDNRLMIEQTIEES